MSNQFANYNGHTTTLNQRYEPSRELRADNHRLLDKHEVHMIHRETTLAQLYHSLPRDLSCWGASAEQYCHLDREESSSLPAPPVLLAKS